jgi:uncharacterized protein
MFNLALQRVRADVNCGAVATPSPHRVTRRTRRNDPLGEHMAAKFEIYKDSKGEFRFRLKAGNGEVVATGESYKNKAGVISGVDAVKRAAAEAEIEDNTETANA